MWWRIIRPLLFSLPPERAHELTFYLLEQLQRWGLWHKPPPKIAPLNLWGLSWAHPLGLAAGMDKNAKLLPFWAHLGFAFVEVGTVTPLPQSGNPRPRLFRIPSDQALLNRMGFNNDGAAAIARRLEQRPSGLIVGINMGKNRSTPLEEAHQDYAQVFCTLRDLGDFFVINVSSPNTPGLRQLQEREALLRILHAIDKHNPNHRPILLKLSPDLSAQQIEIIGKLSVEEGVAGFVAGNTTTQIQYPHLGEGGISGAPLKPLRLKLIQALLPFQLPIIGVGGIFSSHEVLGTLQAGASLVEVYTGFVYRGPLLVREAVEALSKNTP
ncbi:MAG: quinone-dependent dihydroorotate dehydrogenase [Bacteroidia bacterium]|nr:quinone-dependent dihydroorotate dehydrogenase [Bacteroidia bacterium]MDW8235303.1 quinone-dependent dihydroorotate dehydrogenase [Bacteroidia bacterium]